jgi:hypothetical protein
MQTETFCYASIMDAEAGGEGKAHDEIKRILKATLIQFVEETNAKAGPHPSKRQLSTKIGRSGPAINVAISRGSISPDLLARLALVRGLNAADLFHELAKLATQLETGIQRYGRLNESSARTSRAIKAQVSIEPREKPSSPAKK